MHTNFLPEPTRRRQPWSSGKFLIFRRNMPLFDIRILLVTLATLLATNPTQAACSKPALPTYNSATYYAAAEGKTGAELKNSLHNIIKGHVAQTYSCVWDMLLEADQDPANPNNVVGIYTRRSILKANRDQGGNTPDFWNREHVWANSHGFPSSGYHAYTDGHHLFAEDKSVNADRANDDFAYGGTPNPECAACKEDNAKETWEAPDVVKGDVARAMMYMAVRYDGGSGVDGGTPDLDLVDRLTNSGEPKFGDLCDLVAWHLADPVSPAEQTRNQTIYTWQGNRSPFVDHPEYVLKIWGSTCGITPPPDPVDNADVPLPPWALALLGVGLLGALRKQVCGAR